MQSPTTPAPARKKVLLTGAAGRIGSRVAPLLAPVIDLTLTDRTEGEVDGRKVHALDITDYDAVVRAAEGMDAIIHLAIASIRDIVVKDRLLFDLDDGEEYLKFNQTSIDVNMRGTYNLMEAARQKGVKRFILGSSLTVLLGSPRYESFHDGLPARPMNFYAVTKMFCEELGEFFHRRHGLEVFTLRFGTPYPQPEIPKAAAWAKGPAGKRNFVSFRDLAGAIIAATTGPWTRYAPCIIVSEEPGRIYDLSRAQEVLGWQPEDCFDPQGNPLPISG